MARAEAGRHCTVQSITSPWVGSSGLMHLNHLGACAALTTMLCHRSATLITSCLEALPTWSPTSRFSVRQKCPETTPSAFDRSLQIVCVLGV